MNWIGTGLGLTSAVSWACANVSIKSASRRFGSWGALVWAQLVGGGLAALAAFCVEGAPAGVVAAAVPLALAAIASGAAYGGLFAAIERGQLSVVAPIISAWSVISVGIALLLGDEVLHTTQAIGIGMVVIGNAVLARSATRSDDGATPTSALWWALLSAVGFGTVVPTMQAAGTHVGALWTVPLVWGLELAVVLPVLWLRGALRDPPASRGDWWLISRAAVFEVGGFVALSVGLARAPVTVVSPLSSLSTALSVALGLVLLRERVRPIALLGAAAASAGVVLLNR